MYVNKYLLLAMFLACISGCQSSGGIAAKKTTGTVDYFTNPYESSGGTGGQDSSPEGNEAQDKGKKGK